MRNCLDAETRERAKRSAVRLGRTIGRETVSVTGLVDGSAESTACCKDVEMCSSRSTSSLVKRELTLATRERSHDSRDAGGDGGMNAVMSPFSSANRILTGQLRRDEGTY